jgi:Ca2+:H+ antiporter
MRWLSESLWGAAVGLGVATVLTAVASELLVGAIEPVANEVGLSQFFIGLVVLPIVGNAAEHASAITAALRDRMEIGMAITAGSSIQVALLVAPVLVLVGWVIRIPLDLDFNGLELVIFGLVAGLYALVSLDGESTWLEGAQLLAFYLIVAASAFFIPAVA